MKKLNLFIKIFVLSVATQFFISCDEDEQTENKKYTSGVFIVNEGQFTAGNGEISFYNKNDNTVENNIFSNVNERPLGDVVQSMNKIGDKIFVIVNNSHKLEVVNASDFKSIGGIENLLYPNYLIDIDGTKAYLSQWGNGGEIKVIDIATLAITKTIAVGEGASQMVKIGDKVYVANSGGLGTNNTISVLNTLTDEEEATITVGDNPKSIVVDKNNTLWVLCSGKWKTDGTWGLETAGSLVNINIADNSIINTFTFDSMFDAPSGLVIDKEQDDLYYLYSGKVCKHQITSNLLNTDGVISGWFYGLGVDPQTNMIYAANAGDYVSRGWVMQYNPDYSKVDSFFVSVAPNGFYFLNN